MIYINPYSYSQFPNLYSNELNAGGSTNESVSIADAAILKPATTHSACYWAKTTSAATQVYFDKFLTLSGTGSGMFGGKATAYVGSGAAIVQSQSTTSVNTGAWFFICYTYDGTNLRLYINGVLEDTDAAGYTPSSTILSFGRRGTAFPAIGKMAHPSYWNIALSLTQVNEVMTKKMGDMRTTSMAANLIGAWWFPNGQADFPTLTDYSGNGNNGTMQNQENTDINTDIPT